jgi:hypothetical protein
LIYMREEQNGCLKIESHSGVGWVMKILVAR